MLIIIVSGGLTPLRYATHSARRRRKRRRRRRRRNRRRRRRKEGGGVAGQSNNQKTIEKPKKYQEKQISGFRGWRGGGAESAAWEFLPLSERTSDAERKCCCWAKDKSFSLCILVHQVLRRGVGVEVGWGGVGGAVTGSEVEV